MKPLPSEDLKHVLAHTLPLWEAVRGRRLFITGGTGFFGAWLLETFAYCNRSLALNAEATVLTRDPVAFRAKLPHIASETSVKCTIGDVRTFDFPDGCFDYVIHAAAPTSVAAAHQPMDLMRTIIYGADRVVEFAKGHGTRRFLLTSSGAVYGRQPETISHIREDYAGGPHFLETGSVYAEGKRISEQICSIAAKESDIHFAIARCFAFVGPHLPLDQHFAIGNFIGDALAERNIVIRGDGTPLRSYLYAGDLAIWLWTMLLRDADSQENPSVINVGSSEAICIHDLARTVLDELNPELEIETARQPSLGQRREKYIPSVQKAESSYSLHQMIGLREAIRRTAAWHR